METINIGSAPNDGTGDNLRDAFGKVNDNFTSVTRASVNIQTGTTYTVQESDSGKIVDISNSGPITVTLPNNLTDIILNFTQGGAGVITFVAQSGGTLVSRDNYNKTGGQNSMVCAYIRNNTSGTNATWVLAGDLAA